MLGEVNQEAHREREGRRGLAPRAGASALHPGWMSRRCLTVSVPQACPCPPAHPAPTLRDSHPLEGQMDQPSVGSGPHQEIVSA